MSKNIQTQVWPGTPFKNPPWIKTMQEQSVWQSIRAESTASVTQELTQEKNYISAICVTNHIHRKHNSKITPGSILEKSRTSAILCGKSLSQYLHLKSHEKSHTGDKLYMRSLCHQAFWHKLGLEIHVRTHTGEKPWKCNIFDKAFAQKSNLQRHTNIDTEEKPYMTLCCLVF